MALLKGTTSSGTRYSPYRAQEQERERKRRLTPKQAAFERLPEGAREHLATGSTKLTVTKGQAESYEGAPTTDAYGNKGIGGFATGVEAISENDEDTIVHEVAHTEDFLAIEKAYAKAFDAAKKSYLKSWSPWVMTSQQGKVASASESQAFVRALRGNTKAMTQRMKQFYRKYPAESFAIMYSTYFSEYPYILHPKVQEYFRQYER